MDFGKLYKYDKDSILYKPISGVVSFFVLNPMVTLCLSLIILGFVSYKIIEHELTMRDRIDVRDSRIEELENEMRLEKEYDTLLIRIAEASLEGSKKIPFDDETIYSYIKSCNAWYPDIIMAQYKIESASGKSDIALHAHNFFGMRPVMGNRKSFTTQRKGESYKGYAVFDNWKMSILDKILWDHFVFKGKKPTRNEYLAKHRGYAEAEDYVAKINNVAKKYSGK